MVSNVYMIRRWSLCLLVMHSCLAVLLIGSEEFYNWHTYEFWQLEEQRSQKPFSPVLDKGTQQALSVDHWLDARERVFHSLNLPVSILLGWYSHPLSIQSNSILGPFLLRICHGVSVKTRVVILDGVLLLGICLQWWLVGLWLEHSVRFVRALRIIAASMTVLGIAMTAAAIPNSLSAITAVQCSIDLLSLIPVLGWVLLIAIGILSAVWRGAETLKSAS
jgi:hypothetical protein